MNKQSNEQIIGSPATVKTVPTTQWLPSSTSPTILSVDSTLTAMFSLWKSSQQRKLPHVALLAPTYPCFCFLLLRVQKAARFLKEVSISVPNRKEWVIPWAEMAIPEHGVVDSCQEVLRISSVLWAAGPDLDRLKCFLWSTNARKTSQTALAGWVGGAQEGNSKSQRM